MFVLCRNMPDIDTLMQEWPPEFEELLKEVGVHGMRVCVCVHICVCVCVCVCCVCVCCVV